VIADDFMFKEALE